MSLKTSLRNLKLKEPRASHREVLVKSLTTACKIAKISERITFLVQCRRASVFPKFILNIVNKTALISSHQAFRDKTTRFCREMLNEAISESHRKQAFLLREKRRQDDSISRLPQDLHNWIRGQCDEVFISCRQESRIRLLKKFRTLTRSAASTPAHHGSRDAGNASNGEEEDEGEEEGAEVSVEAQSRPAAEAEAPPSDEAGDTRQQFQPPDTLPTTSSASTTKAAVKKSLRRPRGAPVT